MHVLLGLSIFAAVFGISNSLLGIGGGGSILKGGLKNGLGGIGKIGGTAGGMIGGAEGVIGGAEGLIGGAEGVFGGAGAKLGGLLHRKENDDDISVSSEDWSSSLSSEENVKRSKSKHGKRRKTGRGIDKHTGIGSRDGIATPIYDLLGLTKSVCRVSYAGEALIEKLGDFAIGMNHEVRKVDFAIVDFITDNLLLKGIDIIRKRHNDVVKFIVGTHVGFTKFATNSIIEAYRAAKSPLREILAC